MFGYKTMISCHTSQSVMEIRQPLASTTAASPLKQRSKATISCQQRPSASFSHTLTTVAAIMKDDAVAGTDMGLFSQFKASCCPHFHRPLLTPGAERAFVVNSDEQIIA